MVVPLCQDLCCKKDPCSCFLLSTLTKIKDLSKLVLVGSTSFMTVMELEKYPFRVSHCQQTVETFCNKLHSEMESEGYILSQVFNADGTGLWWRLMPSESLVLCGEKQAKKSKDRVTLLGCANAFRTCKLILVFINKSCKPCCFKHMDMTSLPVHYFAKRSPG